MLVVKRISLTVLMLLLTFLMAADAQVEQYVTRKDFTIGTMEVFLPPASGDISHRASGGIIEEALSLGVLNGDFAGSLRLDDPITRQEAAVIINNALYAFQKQQTPDYYLNMVFADELAIGSWARRAVRETYQLGLFSANTNGTIPYFNPKKKLSLAEGQAILDMLSKYVGDAGKASNPLFIDKRYKHLPIITYHQLSQDPNTFSSITVSPEKFYTEMLLLKALGFNPVDTRDLLLYKMGQRPLPPNPIMITFDDGYSCNYEYAYPILQRLNMKAVIAVIGHQVGRETPLFSYFTWEQAREMYESGHVDIQSHTYDLHRTGDSKGFGHGVRPFYREREDAYRGRVHGDFRLSKELIEERVGNQVVLMAYPFGVHTPVSESVAKELGFYISLTTVDGVASIANDFRLLRRINMPANISSYDLIKRISDVEGRALLSSFKHIHNQEQLILELEAHLGLR